MAKKDEPNIALVATRGFTEISVCGRKIELPKDQSRPFYHADAGEICRLFPQFYKPVVAKGDK